MSEPDAQQLLDLHRLFRERGCKNWGEAMDEFGKAAFPSLEAAISKLPLLPEKRAMVERAARGLIAWEEEWGVYVDLILPPARSRGDKAAVRELRDVTKLLSEAASLLRKTSSEAQNAILEFQREYCPDDPPLSILLDRYVWSLEDITGMIEAKPVKATVGRSRKEVAAKVADNAIVVYEELTGKRATYTTDTATSRRSGDFPDFLAEVFKTLGIDASAGAQAVEAVRRSMKR